jgi:choline transport protein
MDAFTFQCADYIAASDAVAHISEEVKDASIIAPRAMFWSFALNIPLAFAILIMSLFTIPDITVATTEFTFPFLSILESNSLPPAGTQAIASLMVVLLFMIAVSTFASTSRQCFAFARDQGLPASDWLRRVDPVLNVPRNSCLFTLGFTIIMCLVYLGSSVTFNAILSIGIVALMATYGLSTGCVLYCRLRWPEALPPARWSLGRWGILVNGIGVSYACFAFFWCFWPIYYSPTPETMNWAVVMFGGVMLLAVLAYFFRGRKMYKGPVATCVGRRND